MMCNKHVRTVVRSVTAAMLMMLVMMKMTVTTVVMMVKMLTTVMMMAVPWMTRARLRGGRRSRGRDLDRSAQLAPSCGEAWTRAVRPSCRDRPYNVNECGECG